VRPNGAAYLIEKGLGLGALRAEFDGHTKFSYSGQWGGCEPPTVNVITPCYAV
jgi:hypothetical protein